LGLQTLLFIDANQERQRFQRGKVVDCDKLTVKPSNAGMEAQGDGNQKDRPKLLKLLKCARPNVLSKESEPEPEPEPESEDTEYDYDQYQDMESDNEEPALARKDAGAKSTPSGRRLEPAS
jgi:hypothetical protein